MANDNDNAGEYTRNYEQVIQTEQDYLGPPVEDKEGYTGLAFSGGGIRSASFALGIMQALVDRDRLKKFDYLSTVSGGGYIGASLTWFLHHKIPAWMQGENKSDERHFGVQRDNFPFGQKYKGNRSAGESFRPNAILDFIRQHGNYLLPGQGLNGTALVGYVLRALVVSLAIYLCLLSAFMVVFQTLNLFQPVGFLQPTPEEVFSIMADVIGANWFFFSAALLALIFLILCFAYSLFTRLGVGKAVRKYQLRVFVQKQGGRLISVALLLIVIGSLRPVHELIAHYFQDVMRWHISAASILTGVAAAASQYRRLFQSDRKLNSVAIIGGGAFLIFGLALMAYWLAEKIILSHTPTLWLTVLMLALTIVVSTCVNINFLGIHRMYRDRLMETFLPNLGAVEKNQWQLATDADTATIDDLCAEPNRRPYHLVNTNVVLVDSHQSKYRGRGGDSFTLSPLFCGSDATGWRRSERYMRRAGRKGMTLATAMAISGAAVNPNAGVGGKGLTRDRIISTVLSVLNLRLGFWAPHPNPRKLMPFPPNFIYPALTGGVLGGGLREGRRAIELTDGGHFENLGIYELIRRKLKLIVITDGGADPNFDFGDLANAVEKVRVDFGATIRFDEGDYCLENLLPGSEPDDYFVRKYNGAKNCFAIADITYNDGQPGKLIYIKTTLVKGLPADLLGYKTACPSFPDEPTSDQFFDETQFEAYRELGYCLGHRFLDANEKEGWL